MAIQSVSNGPYGAPPKKRGEKSVRRILDRIAAQAAKAKKDGIRSFLSQPIALPSLSTIRTKATLYVVILLAATTSVSSIITLRIMNGHILEEIIRKAESLNRSIASAAGYNLLAEDLLGLDNMVYKIRRSNPDINFIAILGPEKDVIVHSDIRKAEGAIEPGQGKILKSREDGTLIREIPAAFENHFEVTSPIVFMDEALGAVILNINRSVLVEAQAEARRKVIGFFALILFVGVASSVLLSTNLTRPIKQLSSGVEELKHGKRSKPLRIYSKDELGRLTSSFNEMTSLITEQQGKLGKYAQDLEEAYVSTIRVLSAAIDARDSYTLGHSTRVSELAMELAKELGLKAQLIEEIEIACLFHDVGKIRIPDSILHKRGRLTHAQFKEMRKHPGYGAEILSKAPSLYKFIPAVRHHHEWHNGTGYPDGLSGEMIPRQAAIISLADAYDAITSDRPYRKAMTQKQALEEIKKASGKQFNPELIEAFLRLMGNRKKPDPRVSREE
jgi:putative nucleotidyltransferase with HDIG domain